MASPIAWGSGPRPTRRKGGASSAHMLSPQVQTVNSVRQFSRRARSPTLDCDFGKRRRPRAVLDLFESDECQNQREQRKQ